MVYDVPSVQVDFVRETRGVDVGFWRAVGSGYTKFAMEVMIDELAREKKMDPVAFRLELLKNSPRASAVVKAVAEMAEWGKKRDNGRVLGIAYADFGPEIPIDSPSKNHCAQVAEVSFNKDTGEIKVHNVWCAVDPGIAVNPAIIVAQIESSVIYGLGQALFEDSVLDRSHGRIVNGNLAEYHVPVNADVGALEIDVVDEDDQAFSPLGGRGIGEIGITGVAAAVANAVYHATGRRVRSLPITLDKLIGR